MMRAPLALAFLLVGSIALAAQSTAPAVAPEEVEVRMAPLAAGSSAGQNFSDASASVAGVLISARTNVLWLNNTNATGAWYVRLEAVGATGITNLASVTVGVDNGTASVAQVTGTLGALTQTTGAYVRLEPASANRIYLTQAVSLLGQGATIPLKVYAADDATGAAYVATDARLTIT